MGGGIVELVTAWLGEAVDLLPGGLLGLAIVAGGLALATVLLVLILGRIAGRRRYVRRAARVFVDIFLKALLDGHGAALKSASKAVQAAFMEVFEADEGGSQSLRAHLASAAAASMRMALRGLKLPRRQMQRAFELAASAALTENEMADCGFDPQQCQRAYVNKVTSALDFAGVPPADAVAIGRVLANIYPTLLDRKDVAEAFEALRSTYMAGALNTLTSVIDFRKGYSTLTREQIADRPSNVLLARYGVLPFRDLSGALDDLLAWCRGPLQLSGRLYIGAGGYGKTRLALQACHELTKERWIAGMLGRDALGSQSAQQAIAQLVKRRGPQGVFLVVDYAETRPDHIRSLANTLKAYTGVGGPVRLMCISRSGGAWWTRLMHAGSAAEEFFDLQPKLSVAQTLPEDDLRRDSIDGQSGSSNGSCGAWRRSGISFARDRGGFANSDQYGSMLSEYGSRHAPRQRQ